MRVVVTGFPKHAPYLARLLNDKESGVSATFYGDTHLALVKAAVRAFAADASICFGGPRTQEIIQAICNLRARPIVLLWAGTDVLTIADDPHELERLRLSPVSHWAVSQNLVSELAELGINARYVNVATANVPSVLTPMPHEFSVLVYLPMPRREFYGQQAVWDAARALSNVRFIAVGAGPRERDAPPNVEYVGDVTDMERYIDGSCALLRITPHDGLPRTIVEALGRGRHAIWTGKLPGTVQVSTTEEAIAVLRAMMKAHRDNALGPNHAGVAYVTAFHEPQAVARGIVHALQDEIEAARMRNSPSRNTVQRLVVSGNELLSARVAANWTKYCATVSASVLSTRSRSEAALSVLQLLTSDYWYTIGEPRQPLSFEVAAMLTRKPRIVHWLAGDATLLHDDSSLLRTLKRRRHYRHVADNASLAQDLERYGLHARVLPLPAAVAPEGVQPLPRQFTLLLYLPTDRPEFYGRYQYERLMQQLAREPVRYIIVGGGHIDVPDGVPVERVAWKADLADVYDRSTALIRLTPPNHIPMMIVEALLHGRHVLGSDDFPFVVRVRDSHGIELEVRSLLMRHTQGTLEPQIHAAQVMNALYSPERCVRLLARALAI